MMYERAPIMVLLAGLALLSAELLGRRRQQFMVRTVLFTVIILYGFWRLAHP